MWGRCVRVCVRGVWKFACHLKSLSQIFRYVRIIFLQFPLTVTESRPA